MTQDLGQRLLVVGTGPLNGFIAKSGRPSFATEHDDLAREGSKHDVVAAVALQPVPPAGKTVLLFRLKAAPNRGFQLFVSLGRSASRNGGSRGVAEQVGLEVVTPRLTVSRDVTCQSS
jgi:hypothetical protein